MNETIAYYNNNAEQFSGDTLHVDMLALYQPFLAFIPRTGKILDAGCGSGRDSLSSEIVSQGAPSIIIIFNNLRVIGPVSQIVSVQNQYSAPPSCFQLGCGSCMPDLQHQPICS